MLSECAVCLAQDDLTVGGGFWTPASAMGDELLERLPSNAGVSFELLD
jgi:saccharopine dehydrogenase (NAD+, L-glutamate forming)